MEGRAEEVRVDGREEEADLPPSAVVSLHCHATLIMPSSRLLGYRSTMRRQTGVPGAQFARPGNVRPALGSQTAQGSVYVATYSRRRQSVAYTKHRRILKTASGSYLPALTAAVSSRLWDSSSYSAFLFALGYFPRSLG